MAQRSVIVVTSFLGFTLLSVVGVLGAWFYLNVTNTAPPYREESPPETLDTDGVPRTTFRAGESVIIHRKYCLERSVPLRIRRYLQNDATLPLASADVLPRSLGCGQESRFIVALPTDLHPDDWTYHVEITYDVNRWRTQTFSLPLVRFRVLPNTLAEQVHRNQQIIISLQRDIVGLRREIGQIRQAERAIQEEVTKPWWKR